MSEGIPCANDPHNSFAKMSKTTIEKSICHKGFDDYKMEIHQCVKTKMKSLPQTSPAPIDNLFGNVQYIQKLTSREYNGIQTECEISYALNIQKCQADS